MASGGHRIGAGRPKGAKDRKPRKRKSMASHDPQPKNNKQKIRELLEAGTLAKAKLYHQYVNRVAVGEKLTTADKRLMVKLEAELSAEMQETEQDKPPDITEACDVEAGDFLRGVWNNPDIDLRYRIQAAAEVLRREGEKKGKKEEKADRARAASSGRFAPAKPPLSLVK